MSFSAVSQYQPKHDWFFITYDETRECFTNHWMSQDVTKVTKIDHFTTYDLAFNHGMRRIIANRFHKNYRPMQSWSIDQWGIYYWSTWRDTNRRITFKYGPYDTPRACRTAVLGFHETKVPIVKEMLTEKIWEELTNNRYSEDDTSNNNHWTNREPLHTNHYRVKTWDEQWADGVQRFLEAS